MTEPLVCCILPYHRPEFVERARACFEAQIYKNKQLHEFNTEGLDWTIGEIRNWMILATISPAKNGLMPTGTLFAHFDHDDWSASERLSEQVAFMQREQADIVGYSELAWYDTVEDRVLLYTAPTVGYSPGTALMYKHEVWDRVKFRDFATGEDASFLTDARMNGFNLAVESGIRDGKPMMIATCHDANSTETRKQIELQLSEGFAECNKCFRLASPELEREVRSCLSLSIVAQSLYGQT
jgi:hypothetical protein